MARVFAGIAAIIAITFAVSCLATVQAQTVTPGNASSKVDSLADSIEKSGWQNTASDAGANTSQGVSNVSPENAEQSQESFFGSSNNASPQTTTSKPAETASASSGNTYSREEIDAAVMSFFDSTTQGLADLIAKAFEDYGQPVGFIVGGEGGAAFVFGLRYGEGDLKLKNGQTHKVYWQGPSAGLDLGANISKVFTMVYNMDNTEQIFQRFPGIDGSLYVIGGFSMNYQQSGDIVLAPIRTGVGLRLGANIGYLSYTREKTINPF